MTLSESAPTPRGKAARRGTRKGADVLADVFDPELFEELRDLRGTGAMLLALDDLSSYLRDNLSDTVQVAPARDETFRMAHFLVARSGLMGFIALRDACMALQHACATGAPFDAEFARAVDAATATRATIGSLHERYA